MRVIATLQVVQADLENILPMRIASRTALSLLSGLKCQGMGNLCNPVAAPAGHVEQLDIKRPAFHALHAEQVLGNGGLEALEAALRILHAGQRQPADHGVHQPAAQVAVERLVVAHRPGRFARADGDLAIGQRRRQEAAEFRSPA